jgi:hypothetical protein
MWLQTLPHRGSTEAMKPRFSKEQIVQNLREAEGAASKAEDCREHGISGESMRILWGTGAGAS